MGFHSCFLRWTKRLESNVCCANVAINLSMKVSFNWKICIRHGIVIILEFPIESARTIRCVHIHIHINIKMNKQAFVFVSDGAAIRSVYYGALLTSELNYCLCLHLLTCTYFNTSSYLRSVIYKNIKIVLS